MNKISKIAMMIALMSAAAGPALGEEIKVDFDGRPSKAFSLMEAASAMELPETGEIKAVPVAELPARQAPEFTADQVESMDKSINTAIKYVKENNLGKRLERGFDCLLKKGTPEEKARFVFINEGADFSFPGACSASGPQNKNLCSWVTEKVCEWVADPATGKNKFVCAMVKMWVCQDTAGAINDLADEGGVSGGAH